MLDLDNMEIRENWKKTIGSLSAELESGTTPQDWIDQGISHTLYKEWYSVGAFNPQKVRQLIDMELKPEDVERKVTGEEEASLGLSYSGYTIAYMWCNSDLSGEDLHKLAGNACPDKINPKP